MAEKTYTEIIESFQKCKVGVVGDMILDIYVFGKPARLSREAPVIVVEFGHEEVRPGGSANAVNNICGLGADAVALGIVGDDEYGRELRESFAGKGIDTEGILVEKGRVTTTKTRVLAGDIHTVKQQVLRIDRGKPRPPDHYSIQSALDLISRKGAEIDCWIVSDYGYGFVCHEIESRIADYAGQAPVIADSRYNVKEFPHITAVTPNENEALNFGRYYLKDETDLMVVGQQMIEILFLKCVLITRGNKGMMVFQRDADPIEIPVVGSQESVDVSGAGDTVTTTFGLSLACGAAPEQAARLANCAASVVVMKSGTATCSREELLGAVGKHLPGK